MWYTDAMKKLWLAAALPLLAVLIPTTAAKADTGCPAGGGVNKCMTLQQSPTEYLNVKGGLAARNTPLIDYPQDSNGTEDFMMVPNGIGHQYQIEYAPYGVRSGFCVSIPVLVEGTPAVLRPCAAGGNMWQTFAADIITTPGQVVLGNAKFALYGNGATRDTVHAATASPSTVWTSSDPNFPDK